VVEIRSEYIDSGLMLFNDAVSVAEAVYCSFIKLQDSRHISDPVGLRIP
jgi:hypothetical protein